jgi:hypothetical protein
MKDKSCSIYSDRRVFLLPHSGGSAAQLPHAFPGANAVKLTTPLQNIIYTEFPCHIVNFCSLKHCDIRKARPQYTFI